MGLQDMEENLKVQLMESKPKTIGYFLSSNPLQPTVNAMRDLPQSRDIDP
jgi:hypothetical protein